jgi:hypothetical protein
MTLFRLISTYAVYALISESKYPKSPSYIFIFEISGQDLNYGRWPDSRTLLKYEYKSVI